MMMQKEILAKSLPQEELKVHTEKVLKNIRTLRETIRNKLELDKDFWKYLELACLVHDAGKIYKGFQKFIKGNKGKELEDKYPGYNIHSLLSPLFFNWLEIDEENWRKIVITAIVFHHYRPDIPRIIWGTALEEWEKIVETVRKEYDEYQKLVEEIFIDEKLLKDEDLKKHLIKLNIDKLARFLRYIIPPDNFQFLPERLKFLKDENWNNEWMKKYVLLKGFLFRADHIASIVTQNEGTQKEKQVNIEIGFTPEFKEVKNNLIKIKKLPENIWQEKAKDYKNSSVILIGSTGIGKTEFAFLWGAGEKIIFTLPIRTMVEQVQERAKEIFGNNVGLLHGTSLIKLMQEQEDISDVLIVREQSKNLSYPFIAATGDQIFTVAFKYPGYEKIMSTLAYSRLVIDEVQGYDPVATAAVVKTIEEVHKLGGKFLIMTATLPDYVKDEIEKRVGEENVKCVWKYDKKLNFVTGCNNENKGEGEDITRHKIHCKKISFEEDDKKKEKKKIDQYLMKIKIKDKNKKNIKKEKKEEEIVFDDKFGKFIYKEKHENENGEKEWCFVGEVKFEKFLDLIKNIIDEHNDRKILIIVNTVNNAQEIYGELKNQYEKEGENVCVLHSRMLDKEKREMLNKITNEGEKPDILITTQIVEASIDIDYYVLITEIAPLESLIQRMGRVNRNRDKYKKNGAGDVYVIGGYLKGTNRIYDIGVLGATWKVLNIDKKDFNENGKISEHKKQKLLEEYYKEPALEKVKEEFEKNLEILDNLYTAESKGEAHRMFREISSINVIVPEGLNEIKKKIDKWKEEDKENLREKLLKDVKGNGVNKKKLTGRNINSLINKVKKVFDVEIKEEEIDDQERFYLNYQNLLSKNRIELLRSILENSISISFTYDMTVEPLWRSFEDKLPDEYRNVFRGFYLLKDPRYRYDEKKGLVKNSNINKEEDEESEMNNVV